MCNPCITLVHSNCQRALGSAILRTLYTGCVCRRLTPHEQLYRGAILGRGTNDCCAHLHWASAGFEASVGQIVCWRHCEDLEPQIPVHFHTPVVRIEG